MKLFKYAMVFIYCLALVPVSNASHIVGMTLTYESVQTGTMLFTLKVYRDCGGIGVATQVPICITSPSGCANDFVVDLLPIPGTGTEVTFNPCNGTGTTTCNLGMLYSFQEYVYQGTVSLPLCSDWIASLSYCCRNYSFTNINVSNAQTVSHIETHFDNLNYPINSSPVFNTMPVNYYCMGQPAIIDFSASDPDGDSLTYEFAPLLEGDCTTSVAVPFIPPYSFDQPFNTFGPTFLDTLGGQIIFTPGGLQYSAMNILVKEYRNGVLIGSVRRDASIMVVGGITNGDTLAGRAYYDINANNAFDTGDIPAENMIIERSQGPSHAVTSSVGKYDFLVPAGTWALDLISTPPYMITPPGYVVNTLGQGAFYGNNDFPIQFAGNIDDLSITLNGYGLNTPASFYNLVVQYSNDGTTNQDSVLISVVLDPMINYDSSLPAADSVSGNTLYWNIASLGFLAGGTINISCVIDSAANGTLTSSASINSPAADQTPMNNVDYVNANITIPPVAPLDPNNKVVTPEGDLSLAFVTSQQWLNYRINFQNVGTGPAQIVKIRDRLDFDLDFGSLEIVASSFPCTMNMQSFNELVFEFFGINLPAASQNLAASIGFVEYRIKPLSTLQPGALLVNKAKIFFDTNPPISTNMVHNYVTLTTDIPTIPDISSLINVYPNPVNDFITVEFSDQNLKNIRCSLINMLGKEIYSQQPDFANSILEIPVSHLSPGCYLLNVSCATGSSITKVIVY